MEGEQPRDVGITVEALGGRRIGGGERRRGERGGGERREGEGEVDARHEARAAASKATAADVPPAWQCLAAAVTDLVPPPESDALVVAAAGETEPSGRECVTICVTSGRGRSWVLKPVHADTPPAAASLYAFDWAAALACGHVLVLWASMLPSTPIMMSASTSSSLTDVLAVSPASSSAVPAIPPSLLSATLPSPSPNSSLASQFSSDLFNLLPTKCSSPAASPSSLSLASHSSFSLASHPSL